MLTKFILEIDGINHELPKRCVKNWGDVKCAYKRSDYSGVTRSFTSQFEFVNEAYDMIMGAYLRDGFNAQAILTLCTITDKWEWEERFSAPLDFSSMSWDGHVLKINSIDNSLASIIKSRKSTKYEFIVGADVQASNKLLYDRIAMINSCEHQIMGHKSAGTSGEVWLNKTKQPTSLPTYAVGEPETYEDNPIVSHDQTESAGSCFIEVVRDTDNLEINIKVSTDGANLIYGKPPRKCGIWLNKDSKTAAQAIGMVFKYADDDPTRTFLGVFPSFWYLSTQYPNAESNSWALIGTSRQDATEAYVMPFGNNKKWERGTLVKYGSGSNFQYGCPTVVYDNIFRLTNLKAGERLYLDYTCEFVSDSDNHTLTGVILSVKSSIQTKWVSRAQPIEIDAIRPEAALTAIVEKMCDGKLNILPSIDLGDERVANTYILAAESVRNIPGAKFYSSFNEFCDWMSAVFGYTYHLGPRIKAPFKRLQKCAYIGFPLGENDQLHHTMCTANFSPSAVVSIEGTPYFAVLSISDDGVRHFYTKWEGSEAYNDPETGKARLDTLFLEFDRGYYFDAEYNSLRYIGDPNRAVLDTQSINFIHKNSLYQGANTIRLEGVRDLRYTAIKDFVVSTIIAGYDKQEYDAKCGRDEWNFSAHYNTGVDLAEKKIELLSKYRADCYGIEFLAQKKAKDTTDSKSDNTVFFAHCRETDAPLNGSDDDATTYKYLEIYRSAAVEGALTDTVFNGEYSPRKCIEANGQYLSAIKNNLILKFASSDGNTDVCIDGASGNSDIPLPQQLFTAGEIEFTTGEIDKPIDASALYELEYNGITYRGFLSEATLRYANNEAVTYKLIVKDIIP